VLRDGRVLVVCEVKTRSSTAYGSPLEAVTERKAARLRRLAARWLADHRVRPDEVRLDLVGVLVRPGAETEIDHVAGVG
jgi:putative endonuclease